MGVTMRDSGHDSARRPKIGGWPLAVSIATVLVFLFFVRHILTPFALAAALAFVLTPPIDWLRSRLKVPRWTIAAAFYAIVLAIIIVPTILYGATLANDMAKAGSQLPQLIHTDVNELANAGRFALGVSIDVDKVASLQI
jgi:predicted PurR-regulated permease PerM